VIWRDALWHSLRRRSWGVSCVVACSGANVQNPLLEILAWLAPCALLVLAVSQSVAFFRANGRAFLSILRRRFATIAVTALTIVVLIFDVPFLLIHFVDPTGPDWKYWLATISGNWSPDSFPGLPSGNLTPPQSSQSYHILSIGELYKFSLSASLAFWLNNAIIIVVSGLVWSLFAERIKQMNVATAWKLRDQMALALVDTLAEEEFDNEEIREKVKSLFRSVQEQSLREMKETLPGRNKADIIAVIENSPSPK
jgi:hypothetical protein